MSFEQNAQQAHVLGYTVKNGAMDVEALPSSAVLRLKEAARKSAVGLVALVALSVGGVDTADASCLNEGVRGGTQQVNPVNRNGTISLYKLDRLRQMDESQGWRIVDRAIDRVIDDCARDSGVKARDRRMIRDLIKRSIKIFGDVGDRIPKDLKLQQSQNVFLEMANSSIGTDATLRSFASHSDTKLPSSTSQNLDTV